MKTLAIGLCLIFICCNKSVSQSTSAAGNVIEGGKIVVELLKTLTGKKDNEKNGCKGTYADLCVVNESPNSIIVTLQRSEEEGKKEMVILPSTKECCLRIPVGVWTYDLRLSVGLPSIRKGDILIEGCQNMVMNIK